MNFQSKKHGGKTANDFSLNNFLWRHSSKAFSTLESVNQFIMRNLKSFQKCFSYALPLLANLLLLQSYCSKVLQFTCSWGSLLQACKHFFKLMDNQCVYAVVQQEFPKLLISLGNGENTLKYWSLLCTHIYLFNLAMIFSLQQIIEKVFEKV